MQRWLQDPASMVDVRREASLQAARFSWEKTAKETLEAYRSACGMAACALNAAG
jgi:glycosyltransferase involved in cell wall biosynthesis